MPTQTDLRTALRFGLPGTLPTTAAATLVGLSRATLARHADTGLAVGDNRILPIRIGAALAWPTAPILAALGLDGDAAAEAVAAAVSTARGTAA